jgi:hypothetical protein
MDRRVKALVLWLLAGWLMTIAALVVGMVELNARTEHKFCTIVASVDDQYKKTPPATAAGRETAANWARLRSALGCP